MSGTETVVATKVVAVLETEEARTLLEAGREAGSLTADEITLALDELDLDAGQIDDFYQALEELQIEVVAAEEEEDPAEEIEVQEVSTDSLQLFLKDVGRSTCSPPRRRSSSRSASSAAITARSRRWSRRTCGSSSRSRSATATRVCPSSI